LPRSWRWRHSGSDRSRRLITEWKPRFGAPLLNETDWHAEFAKYQRTPQYILVNGPAGMTLATYKVIFFWEWVHRLLARTIGLAFAAPLAWFWLRGQIPAATNRASSRCWRSALCKGRSAGGWSNRASSMM